MTTEAETWETACERSPDGQHCEHWYDGARCHYCGTDEGDVDEV